VFKGKLFIEEHNEKVGRLENCQNLVAHLGKGVFVNSVEEADLVLIGSDEDKQRYAVDGKICNSWNEMIESIPGPIESKGVYKFKPEKCKDAEQKNTVESDSDHTKEKTKARVRFNNADENGTASKRPKAEKKKENS